MELTLQQAKNFCNQRKWFVTEPPHRFNYCTHCKVNHPFAVEIMGFGINRFHSEKEFIDWVIKLIPNSI